MAKQGVDLPPLGEYGVGMVFLPKEPASRLACEYEIERAIKEEGQVLLGWRDVRCDNSGLGESVQEDRAGDSPGIHRSRRGRNGDRCAGAQAATSSARLPAMRFRRSSWRTARSSTCRRCRRARSCTRACCWRRRSGRTTRICRTPRVVSALALVHQRFSTNTFPTWDLAHPFRLIAHNGEINTLRGNVNWIRARQGAISARFSDDDLRQAVAADLRRPVRYGFVRQRAGTAASWAAIRLRTR